MAGGDTEQRLAKSELADAGTALSASPTFVAPALSSSSALSENAFTADLKRSTCTTSVLFGLELASALSLALALPPLSAQL